MRLPKQVAFPELVQNFEITAIGNKRMIMPADHPGKNGLLDLGLPVAL